MTTLAQSIKVQVTAEELASREAAWRTIQETRREYENEKRS